MKKPSVALVLIVLAAFCAPLMGGVLSLDTQAVMPGFANLLYLAFASTDLPAVSHAVISVLVIGAGIAVLVSRKVIQVPNPKVYGGVLLFLGVLLASVLNSVAKAQSLQSLGEWLVYGLALFAVVASVGRRDGPTAVVASIFLGVVFLARNGIVEYKQNSAVDSTWRIFAGWQQPNALAGILTIGIFLGIGLTLTQKRVWALVSFVCILAIGYALFRTQSKGGVLAFAASLVLLVTLFAGLKFKPNLLPWIGRLALIAVVLGNIAAIFLTKMPTVNEGSVLTESAQGSASILGRFAKGGETAEQSVGFRKLLYVTSMKLLQDDPVGYGMGTFRMESARPGLITQTHLAHNTLLQLAVEASPVAPFLFLALLALWLEFALRDSGSLPWKTNALRMCIVAAVFGTLLHGITESNLYTFGLGLTFFMLLGLGLVLSADAVSPEFTPKSGRVFGGIAIVVTALLMIQTASSEYLRSELRAQIQGQDIEGAKATVEQLKSIAGSDGETWYSAALIASANERKDDLHRASELEPIPRNFRAYATSLALSGEIAQGVAALNQALRFDPNNQLALLQRMKLQDSNGNIDAAVASAKQLVGVEKTIYYQIRSLPDLIPTETFEARLYLAKQEKDPAQRILLLKGAVEGYTRFLGRTWPSIQAVVTQDPNGSFGGINLQMATDKLETGQGAAKELAALYRAAGDAAGAKEADAAAEGFAKALTPAPSK